MCECVCVDVNDENVYRFPGGTIIFTVVFDVEFTKFSLKQFFSRGDVMPSNRCRLNSSSSIYSYFTRDEFERILVVWKKTVENKNISFFT